MNSLIAAGERGSGSQWSVPEGIEDWSLSSCVSPVNGSFVEAVVDTGTACGDLVAAERRMACRIVRRSCGSGEGIGGR